MSAQIQLRKAIEETCTLIRADKTRETFRVCVKPALMASSCSGCGRSFRMTTGPSSAGQWWATMSGIGSGNQGNMLELDCCSFECAQTLEDGGWKKPKSKCSVDRQEAAGFAKAKRHTISVEFSIGFVEYEEDLVAKWEAMPQAKLELEVAPRNR